MWPLRRSVPPDKGASSSKRDPPDGIRKVSDSVYALCEPPDPPEIEIVFIHGLQLCDYNEAYWRTWIAAENDKGGGEICWPMAWLGEEFPRARILSLKYDSCILRTKTTGRMDGFVLGESLVQEMVGLANIGQGKHCPVVFICHSVGGLVVKEIVIQAHRRFGNEAKYVNFLQNIGGFQFYGTPHEGSKLGNLTALVPKFSVGGMVELVKVLNEDLGRLNEEFEHIGREHYANRWRFSVVAETHITTWNGFSAMVVEEASARHGYDKFLSVGADHFGVCKPSDRASSSYLASKELIELVVADNRRRNNDLVKLPDYLVGMGSRVQEVGKKMEGHSVVALVGMGGVGKTTLSKYVYKEEKDRFDGYCFLEDVKSCRSIEACQRQLFCDLCGGRWDENESVNFHMAKVKDCILSKKVLVVVDDVGDEANMKALQVATFKDGKSGSRVIVTTRRRDILFDFMDQEGIVDVDFLSRDESLELFSYYAFNGVEECVRAQFDGKAKVIVEACGELPLSLEIIGQFLRSKWKEKGCESVEKLAEVWDEALERLKNAKSFDGSNNDKLWAKLKISFDDLCKEEQGIFLDMACILCRSARMLSEEQCSKMLSRDSLERIWSFPVTSIQNLTNRSLIKWSGDGNTLVIHDQLQDMACGIVMDELDGNRSRMWDVNGCIPFMQEKQVSKSLEGLVVGGGHVSLPMFQELKNCLVGMRGVQSFEHLRLLSVVGCGGDVVWNYMHLCTNELRWLNITGSSINVRSIQRLEYLQGLRVLYLNQLLYLESLPTSIGKLSLLTELDLSQCERLESLPKSIGGLSKLQVLRLGRCYSLKTLPASIGKLFLLNELVLYQCRTLESLPESIGGLSKLQVLRLDRCYSLKTLPASIGKLLLLTELDLSWCKTLESLPVSIGGLSKLQVLRLGWCSSLKRLPVSIGKLSVLTELDLSQCETLESLPGSIDGLSKLQVLKLGRGYSLKTLPASIGNLSLLIELELSQCKRLESLPESIDGLSQLQVLRVWQCSSLKTLPTSIGKSLLLTKLEIDWCETLESLPESIGELSKLQVLRIRSCVCLKALPASIGKLSLLIELDLYWCKTLESLPKGIGGLNKLQVLRLNGCSSLKSLPESIGKLLLLTKLDLSQCETLESLPKSIDGLSKLQVLSLEGCSSLKSLPTSIGKLSLLNELFLYQCKTLKSLPESFGELNELGVLSLWDCSSLKTLPTSFGKLLLLNELNLSWCKTLESLPESIGGLSKLQVLKLIGCSSLKTLPASIGKLSFLKKIDLSNCKTLGSLPESIGELNNLQVLRLGGCSSLNSLPTSIGNLSLLNELDLAYCFKLKFQVLRLYSCSSLKTLPLSIWKVVTS